MALRRIAALLILALTGLTVFVLSSRDEQPRLTPVAQPGPSGTDVHYARMMVAHHQQAVRMSNDLIAKGDVPERIRLIAEFIAHDQQREIDRTNEWLSAWDVPAAAPSAEGHGMLTAAQLDGLDRAALPEATKVYLRLMIEHHEGAVTMSRSLLDGPPGNPFIHTLAKHVINEQTAEIDSMKALLR